MQKNCQVIHRNFHIYFMITLYQYLIFTAIILDCLPAAFSIGQKWELIMVNPPSDLLSRSCGIVFQTVPPILPDIVLTYLSNYELEAKY